MGIQCVQCIRTVTVSSMRGCSSLSVVDPGSEERERTGFWGFAPKIFCVHFSQFGALFKELAKIGGGGGVLPAATAYPLFYQSMCKPWP